MMEPEKKKAEVSTAAGTLGNGNGSSPQEVGLSVKINRFGRCCTTPDDQGMMSVPGGFAGCRGSSLRIDRRLTATPGTIARGVSFWRGIRSTGLSVPIDFVQIMTGGRAGILRGCRVLSHGLLTRTVCPPILSRWLGRLEKPEDRSIVMMLKPAFDAQIASAEALPGAVSTNPSINSPVRSEAIAEDIGAILSACRKASVIASGRCREAVRMQVIDLLHEVASAGRVEVRHG